MFSKFKYERIPLSLIRLDDRNPRIVTQNKLKSEQEILEYFFEHENLAGFMKKIASEGHNQGAERPYVVKDGKSYIVVEGNTRIAAYKLLTGALNPPSDYASSVPHIPDSMKQGLSAIDCTVAPTRDALLPIMASAHFGLGDKSKWGWLGSRKAVFDEWKSGRSINHIATVFDKKPGEIRGLILEYQLYLEALKLNWTSAEKEELLKPGLEFNPPVRFLQSTGHKSAVGIDFDRTNLGIIFTDGEGKDKFKHLVHKLVVETGKGLKATSSYKEVFADYTPSVAASKPTSAASATNSNSVSTPASGVSPTSTSTATHAGPGTNTPRNAAGSKRRKGILFVYPSTTNSAVHQQLMKEAKSLNFEKFPAAGTALLRCIVETILKSIIHDQGANSDNKLLSLETALDSCLSKRVVLSPDDKRILKEFKRSHVDYVNLGTHGTVVPNPSRLEAARDCIDQFVMRNI